MKMMLFVYILDDANCCVVLGVTYNKGTGYHKCKKKNNMKIKKKK